MLNSNRNNFCTLFSKNYILQGVALLKSIEATHHNSVIWVFTLDAESKKAIEFLNLDNVRCLAVSQEELLLNKFTNFQKTRTFSESVFSMKPFFMSEVLHEIQEGEWLIYLDADTFAFDTINTSSLLENHCVLLSPHYFSDESAHNIAAGYYNAGAVGFKNSLEGRKACAFWADLCQISCTLNKENGYYADQKYLEDIKRIWDDQICEMIFGINVGGWSLSKETNVRETDTHVQINETNLCLFHFHGYKTSLTFNVSGISRYGKFRSQKSMKRFVYSIYRNALAESLELFSQSPFDGKVISLPLFPKMGGFTGLLNMLIRKDLMLSKFSASLMWKFR